MLIRHHVSLLFICWLVWFKILINTSFDVDGWSGRYCSITYVYPFFVIHISLFPFGLVIKWNTESILLRATVSMKSVNLCLLYFSFGIDLYIKTWNQNIYSLMSQVRSVSSLITIRQMKIFFLNTLL